MIQHYCFAKLHVFQEHKKGIALLKSSLIKAELQAIWDIEDNLKIIFLISQ